jgi:D-tyrosyl-tRNA(Tyr) deacylase
MKVLLQRCTRGSVTVDGEIVGAIGRGIVTLVGTTHGDDLPIARRLAERVAGYRIFPDEDGRTNLSVRDIEGAVLVVPQFTLYANTKKGRRPSFMRAGDPALAQELVGCFRLALEELGVPTAQGRFGANMQVELVNDGPFTILLEHVNAPSS